MVSRFEYAEMQMKKYELYLAKNETNSIIKEIENLMDEINFSLASMELRDPEEAKRGMEIFERNLQKKMG